MVKLNHPYVVEKIWPVPLNNLKYYTYDILRESNNYTYG